MIGILKCEWRRNDCKMCFFGIVEESGRKKRPSDLRIMPIHRYTMGIITAENPYNIEQQVTQKLNSLR